MVQFFNPQLGPSYGAQIAQALGLGMEKYQQKQQKQKGQSQLARRLFGEEAEKYEGIPMDEMLKAAQIEQAGQMQQQKNLEQSKKELKEQQESRILAKRSRGEKLTEEEEASLSPTSLRTLIGQEKPMFEPTEEKLEAERVSKLADQIVKDHEAARSEDMRLDRMEKLSEKGDLSTPLMVKTLDTLGLPLSILGNPDSEEFQKLEADFVRDVSSVFPGQIRVFEIQAYMKTVPGLMNSKDGRQRIIQNRRLFNEAKNLKFQAYKDIVKENGGRKPRNLDLLIEERIGPQLNALGEKFKEGIRESASKFLPTYRIRAPNGKIKNISANDLEEALKNGGQFL